MVNKKIDEISVSKKSYQNQSQNQAYRVGFEEMLELVKDQVEFNIMEEEDKASITSICLMIAEVLMLPSGRFVRINGASMPVDIVKAAYNRLTCEDIKEVLDSYQKISYKINHVKSYIRTALYNIVFDGELRAQNLYNAKQSEGQRV